MHIITSKLQFQEVLNILKQGENDFHPPLSQSIELVTYAEKLSTYANFVTVRDENTIVGCIAYYNNDDGKFIYISHYWVNGEYQHNHYGQRMLEVLIDNNRNKYNEIRLEVVKDNPAYFFYQKNGFVIHENRENKYLLTLSI